MSRVGKLPVKVPNKVNVSIDKDTIVIKGPKGELSMPLSEYVTIDQNDDTITFKPINNSPKTKKLFGIATKITLLSRLLQNEPSEEIVVLIVLVGKLDMEMTYKHCILK